MALASRIVVVLSRVTTNRNVSSDVLFSPVLVDNLKGCEQDNYMTCVPQCYAQYVELFFWMPLRLSRGKALGVPSLWEQPKLGPFGITV